MASPHQDEDMNTIAPFTFEECLDEVAAEAYAGCGKCNSTDSKAAYKVRMGYPLSETVALARRSWLAPAL
jgi:hypothetical protein